MAQPARLADRDRAGRRQSRRPRAASHRRRQQRPRRRLCPDARRARLPALPGGDEDHRGAQPEAAAARGLSGAEQLSSRPWSRRSTCSTILSLASLRSRSGLAPPALAIVGPSSGKRFGSSTVGGAARRRCGREEARRTILAPVEQTKYLLDESQLPRRWYNVAADMPNAA